MLLNFLGNCGFLISVLGFQFHKFPGLPRVKFDCNQEKKGSISSDNLFVGLKNENQLSYFSTSRAPFENRSSCLLCCASTLAYFIASRAINVLQLAGSATIQQLFRAFHTELVNHRRPAGSPSFVWCTGKSAVSVNFCIPHAHTNTRPVLG